MTSTASLSTLSDHDLLTHLAHAVRQERLATADVVALLMEVDARKLYAQQSCSSLFTYCVQKLHLSEHAAYLRIEAARAARRFPAILAHLRDGSMHLTAVSLVAPHLTDANHSEVLAAATHKSKRDVEQLVARLRPKPDVPASIRKLPTSQLKVEPEPPVFVHAPAVDRPTVTGVIEAPRVHRSAGIKPLAPERFKVQFTVSRETHDKLRQAQDLLRHVIPNGDPAAIFDRALTVLLAEATKTKCAATDHPRPARMSNRHSRHIPAPVKREVWRRDAGRCAFSGEQGRCGETGHLEFHHVMPYARGGPTTVENLELRCRAHNVYEAEQLFGTRAAHWARESAAEYVPGPATRSGPTLSECEE
jgi:5-methylcytosine-specific restriction endonuclease McrA